MRTKRIIKRKNRFIDLDLNIVVCPFALCQYEKLVLNWVTDKETDKRNYTSKQGKVNTMGISRQ